MKLEKEKGEMAAKLKALQQSNERMEMELMYSRGTRYYHLVSKHFY